MRETIQFFNSGGTLKLDDSMPSADAANALTAVPGLMEKVKHLGLTANETDAARTAAGEFILEGLYALKRIGRDEELGFVSSGEAERMQPPRAVEPIEEEDDWPRRRRDKRRNFN